MSSLEPIRGLSPPPREVPFLVCLRILFGGFLNQFGWLFFGFGMIFVWIFAFSADVTGWYVFSGDLETAHGTVTSSEKTNASVGGSNNSPGTPIHANHYSFVVDGERHEGVSYSTGGPLESDQPVSIEFPKGDPSTSRIRGMRREMFGPVVLFVLLFPLVGLAFVAAGWRRGRRAVRLLARGVQGFGTLKSKERTNTQVNNKTVYKLTFEFDVDGHSHLVTARTHEPSQLEDQQTEPLLFNPENPDDATLLDHLPGAPSVDELGKIRTERVVKTLLVCLIPIASIVGHGLVLISRFL